ncbi:MAG: zf-TFIIB domain-containing protein, partial [Chloroflexota bacterium]
ALLTAANGDSRLCWSHTILAMLCPICKTDMLVVEHKRVEMDYCIKCGGVWFDSGELELLLHGLEGESATALDYREARALEVRRRCPVCRRKMTKATVGQSPEVLIDVCPGGDGLWFDGGELGQLVRQRGRISRGVGAERKALAFLGETFKASARG